MTHMHAGARRPQVEDPTVRELHAGVPILVLYWYTQSTTL